MKTYCSSLLLWTLAIASATWFKAFCVVSTLGGSSTIPLLCMSLATFKAPGFIVGVRVGDDEGVGLVGGESVAFPDDAKLESIKKSLKVWCLCSHQATHRGEHTNPHLFPRHETTTKTDAELWADLQALEAAHPNGMRTRPLEPALHA